MEGKTEKDVIRRELLFFKIAGLVDGYEGPGRYQHLVNLCNLCLAGQFKWHPWLEDQLEEYCRTPETLITGPSSGGKTVGMAIHFNFSWLCSPMDTGALVCSTTRDGLKRRVWGDIRRLYLHIRKVWPMGRLVDSDLTIQTSKGDSKHGIFGITVAAGEETKALGRIIGFHPRRIFVGVDELTDVSWAIIEALTNLFTAKQKAQFIGVGNASFYFDSHGKMCEPKEGWNSVTVDSDRWETKRGGICLHFDGFKCENVITGKKVYDFLLTQDDIDKTEREHGINSPQMWRMRRGFWCPEGTTKTVLNHSLIAKFLAFDRARFTKDSLLWASLDAAFEGGDRCILRFGKTGLSDTGVDVLELAHREDGQPDIVTIKTDATLKDKDGRPVPIHYQIAYAVKSECEARGIPPERFGLDTTGEGGGLASIISEVWGHGFVQVEFGGKASDLPVSEINSKPRNKEYKNRVTELWYSFRAALMLGQIKGIDPETASEFCNRIFTVGENGIIVLEPKREMKSRAGMRSPDLADSAAVLLYTVQYRGGLGKALSATSQRRAAEWQELADECAEEESHFDADPFQAVL